MPPPAEGFAARFVLGPALRTQPDRRLVTLVRDGYENAFEEIVRRYGKPLTRYAAAIVGARGEDVTQDAFSKALLALRRNDAEIELRPWLFRIVRNTALNDLRDSPPAPEALAEAIAGGRSPAEELERREELTDLMRRLQSLPEPQRAAIVMREMEGLSHEEIAAALGVSGGAARQTIHRARQTLRNGAGMLVPLPLLKALLAASTMGTAEIAAGAGGAAGAGVALKAVTATVLVAGAVGAGVAVHDSGHGGNAPKPKTFTSASSSSPTARTAFATPAARADDDHSGSGHGDNRGRGTRKSSEDHGQKPTDDHAGHGTGTGDDHSGHGPDHSGSGSGSDEDERGRGDDSGSGSGGPGPSGEDDAGDPAQAGPSHHGGGPGPSAGSEPSGGGLGDNLVPAQETGSSGPGPSESQERVKAGSGSGGPGPGDGSVPGDESGSGSGSGSGGGDDDHVDG